MGLEQLLGQLKASDAGLIECLVKTLLSDRVDSKSLIRVVATHLRGAEALHLDCKRLDRFLVGSGRGSSENARLLEKA